MSLSTFVVLAHTGPLPTAEDVARHLGSLAGWGIFAAAISTFATSLVASAVFSVLSILRRWPAFYSSIPLLFWALEAQLVLLGHFRLLVIPPSIIESLLHAALALVLTIVLAAASALRAAPSTVRPAHLFLPAFAVTAVFLDWALVVVLLTPFGMAQ